MSLGAIYLSEHVCGRQGTAVPRSDHGYGAEPPGKVAQGLSKILPIGVRAIEGFEVCIM